MQEPKDDKDSLHCENINKFINNPPQPGQTGNANPLAGLDIGGMDQNQLLQQLFRGGMAGRGGRGGASALAPGSGEDRPQISRPNPSTASAPAAAPHGHGHAHGHTHPHHPQPSQTQAQSQPQPAAAQAQSGVSRQALENLLSSFAQQVQPQQTKGPSLNDVVDADKLISSGLFENPQVVAKLAEFLPEGPVTAANIKEHIRSPQFQQAVSMFNQALKSGQVGAIMASFGLDASSVGPNATIEDFLLALQKKAKEEKDKKMDTSQ